MKVSESKIAPYLGRWLRLQNCSYYSFDYFETISIVLIMSKQNILALICNSITNYGGNGKSKSKKSKSKKTLFNVGQCKQYNISSHLKWVLVADKSMHMIIYNEIHIK